MLALAYHKLKYYSPNENEDGGKDRNKGSLRGEVKNCEIVGEP
jgi:hypothetical protein